MSLIVVEQGEGDAIAIVAIIGGSCLIRSLSLPHSNIGLDGIGLLGTAIAGKAMESIFYVSFILIGRHY
jgi:hypothetical protein